LRISIHRTTLILSFLLFVFVGPAVSGQEKNKPQAPKQKPDYVLKIRTEPIVSLSLKAEKSNLSAIGADLSKRLKVPVFVGPTLQKQPVSIEFSDLTLEPALQLMAPHVYVDYELETGSGNPPKPLGIYLFDADQNEPSPTAVVPGSTQSLLIEGDTEEVDEPATEEEKKKVEAQPLRIQFRDGLLSVKAKKQPLVLVLLKIGEELGIPVDIQNQSSEVIDTEISKAPIEDALRRMSPNIRLFLRADLTHSDRRALRIALPQVEKSTQ
jgi:hypothetical protein